jgi:hypothetical protein
VETIHKEPSGITAQHIKTKEASQDLYGGGEQRGGKKGCARGTSWCVSARSEGNSFGEYGHMYTVHDPHDENAPYAVHPFHHGGTITSRHNDGDEPYKEVVNNNPRIKPAVDKIMKHSAKHVDDMMKSGDEDQVYRGINHPHATPKHITQALNHPDYGVRSSAAAHSNATPEHITKSLKDHDLQVRVAAIRNPNANSDHITQALNDKDESVRSMALHHKNSTPMHMIKGIGDSHLGVSKLAMQIAQHRGWVK